MTRDLVDVERTFNRARGSIRNAVNALAGLKEPELEDLMKDLREIEAEIVSHCKRASRDLKQP